ncbi:DUF3466 family protein [Agaribacter flavus]|uniref:DUF3466 family protein n=1 Tax=Agaribacter flavus TaxID=1902781 RepID=A0ABV7FPR4_9ALTE
MKRTPIVSALLLALVGAINNAEAASYEVQTLPFDTISQEYFAASIDNTGLMLITARDAFNPPIDLSILDLNGAPLSDPDEAAQGNFNDFDYQVVVERLRGAAATLGRASVQFPADARFQKLASELAYKTDGTDTSYIFGFDQETEGTAGFTFALDTRITDSVFGSHIVGNMPAPFFRLDYVDENGEDQIFVINDFLQRGFVQVGDNVTALLPPNIEAGGYSEAYQINENFQVAGVSSIGTNDVIQERLTICNDDEQRADVPVEACVFSIFNQLDFSSDYIPDAAALYGPQSGETRATSLELRPTIWQLDAEGNLLSTQVYDSLHEPDEFSAFNYTRGLDINNAGTMVGFSTVLVDENALPQVAAVFENGVTTRLVDDDEFLPSYATQINDNNFIVGFVAQRVNNALRNKMFVFDRNTNENRVVQGFFLGSATYPRAMNNNNIVVGDAESNENVTAQNRPRVGFMYDINSDTFTNLNDLLPCDSPYKIISATDINDNNEILADAFVSLPFKNPRGVVQLDDAGEERMFDTVISVKLNPTGNPPADCGETDNGFRERQGASITFWLVLPLLIIALYRRLKFS